MRVGAVIPVGAGREENTRLAIDYLLAGEEQPEVIVVVCDGPDAYCFYEHELVRVIKTPQKHEPGMEPPRNAGVRYLVDHSDVTHAWFVDSDVIVAPEALRAYREMRTHIFQDAVMIGPYEFLEEHEGRLPRPDIFRDTRWEMFRTRGGEVARGDLGLALGGFSGNLMWMIDQFIGAGGFHPMLHAGRCDDGELGIRAARLRIPMVCVPRARGWHVHHPRNMEWIYATNAIDVPLIHRWHGRAEEYQGLVPMATEGARLEWICPNCRQQINTGEMWGHQASCR